MIPKKTALVVPKKVVMMMKAVKLGWAGPGAGEEQAKSKARASTNLHQNSLFRQEPFFFSNFSEKNDGKPIQ